LEFSPDGRHLVAAGSSLSRDGKTPSGIIKIWVRD
jgi:hypothetical protein